MLVESKNHSKVGEGESDCVMMSAEHSRVNISPAVPLLGSEGETTTALMSTVGKEKFQSVHILHRGWLTFYSHMFV